MNIRLLFHKPIASLFYTLYLDSKVFCFVFSVATCALNTYYLNKLQKQKPSVRCKFKKKSFHCLLHTTLWEPCKRGLIKKIFTKFYKNQGPLLNDKGSVTVELLVKPRQHSQGPQFQLKLTFQWHPAKCLRPISWWLWWWGKRSLLFSHLSILYSSMGLVS